MHADAATAFDSRIAPDSLQQRHDLMIELYRLDQAGALARRQERNDVVGRIDHARQRVADLLARLPA